MRNRLYHECRARACQDIAELRRTNSARQSRLDELSLQSERNPTTVSPLLTQNQDLQDKVNFLSVAREFYDPDRISLDPKIQIKYVDTKKPTC